MKLLWLAVCWFLAQAAGGQANDLQMMLVAPATVTAGVPIRISLYVASHATQAVAYSFPRQLEGRIEQASQWQTVTMPLWAAQSATAVSILPGAFRQCDYLLQLPPGQADQVTLECPGLAVSPIVLRLEKPMVLDTVKAQPGHLDGLPEPGAPALKPVTAQTKSPDPVEFFKRHFFPYEPFYFIAGADSPNAKFQISFKYRLLNQTGVLADKMPVLNGLHLAYTQTSLWDLEKPSAPFLDSSYKPEVLYALERVDARHWADWLRLDLQGGMQHESNGRDGSASRSLNIAYFRPAVTFGREAGWFLSVSPRAWVYAGDLSDNPDLAHYRGYADLRLATGWARSVQLASSLRMGDRANRGSVQLDLTYPLSQLLTRSFSFYLHAQYFTGYGESLLLYRERSSAFRVGISLFR